LQRFVCDLLAWELKKLRPGSRFSAPALPWDRGLDLSRDLLADSLETLSLATALGEAIHLAKSGIGDKLLERPVLGDWLDIARQGLGRYDAAITFRTSGSTGRAKSCTHGLDLLEQEIAALVPLLGGRRRILCVVPSHHMYGFLFSILLPRALGLGPEDCVDLRGSSPARLQHDLRAGDLVIGHPEFWSSAARVTTAFAPGVVGVTSTAPCPVAVARDLAVLGLERLLEIYGSSETAGVAWRDDLEAPFRLFDYWTRVDGDEATLLRTLPGGAGASYPLQDRLHWQDERRFFLGGRVDNAVQVGGVNVFPGRVRDVLMRHPAVQDAAVRLMRIDEGLRLKAFVVPREPLADPEALREELLDWARKRLSAPELPKAITLGPELPREANGKPADWMISE
jgi:4-coumarate--CoA ligase (photoactive yellow protein activation family)